MTMCCLELQTTRVTEAPEAAGMGFFSSASCSGLAIDSGVCPPNCTMMPSGRSFSMTFKTSSTYTE
jgi:hypothetical protein